MPGIPVLLVVDVSKVNPILLDLDLGLIKSWDGWGRIRGGKNPKKIHFAWVVTFGFWVLGFGFLVFWFFGFLVKIDSSFSLDGFWVTHKYRPKCGSGLGRGFLGFWTKTQKDNGSKCQPCLHYFT